MDIAQLQNFQMIAKIENLTKAAENLHISQPALSASLNRLENELGVELFDRVGRRLHLNECGKIYLRYVNAILENIVEAESELASYIERTDPILTFYITSKHGLDEYYLGYGMEHPETVLKHIEVHTRDIHRTLLERDCDFIVTTCINPEDFDCAYEQVNETALLVAVPKTNPLSSRKLVHFEDLKDENFIYMPSRNSFQYTTDQLCREAGFVPRKVAECFFCQLFTYLLGGAGISFVTESHFRSFSQMAMFSNELALIPVYNGDTPIVMKNVLLWRKDRKLSVPAKQFLQYVRKKKDQTN